MNIKRVVLIVAVASLTSCQSSSGDSPHSGNSSPKPAVQSDDPRGSSATSSGASDIGAASMIVLQNSNAVSLAAIAAKASGTVTVFQFAGVTCESCKTETPYVTSALSKFGQQVAHIVVFPNKASEYSPSEYLEFTSRYANAAAYVIDDSLSVLKKVRANVSQYFGVYVLVTKDGKGIILNQEQAYKDVQTNVSKILGQ